MRVFEEVLPIGQNCPDGRRAAQQRLQHRVEVADGLDIVEAESREHELLIEGLHNYFRHRAAHVFRPFPQRPLCQQQILPNYDATG